MFRKKSLSDELFPFFLQKCRIWPFLNYLHDSNSIFWAQGIKSEWVLGRTVQTSVRQASSRSGCAKSPSLAQRRVPQIREPESCGHAQSVEGEVRNCVGIMLGLVDRSDEVVIGTTGRVVKARSVHRMLVGQRGDAAYAKEHQRCAVATECS